MAKRVETSAATLNCLCGAIKVPGTYLKDSHLPIESEICHCNPCRYTSGSLIPTFFELRERPPASVFDQLESYQFTPYCIRYFCKTCGTHCFVDHPQKENEWFCTSGIVDIPDVSVKPPNLLSVWGHCYVADTIDGGLTPLFLRNSLQDNDEGDLNIPLFGASGRELETRLKASEVFDLAKAALAKSASPQQPATLAAKCHCGGVNLSVARADFKANPHNVDHEMYPSDPKHHDKYVAYFCACRSCRLATGFSMSAHIYIPPGAITDAITGDSVVFGLDALNNPSANRSAGLKTLKQYKSSDRAVRSFCSRCGAYVFFASNEWREHGVIDIACGLLRAESGAMAREWAYWLDGPDCWDSDALDQDVLDTVRSGWKDLAWGNELPHV